MKTTFPVLFFLAILTSCNLLGNGDDDRPDIPGKIVFAAEDANGNSQIYRMNANGSGLQQLTHLEDGHEAHEPSWSPDGQQIVFSTSLRASSNGLSLYVMDANGNNMRPLHERENSHIPTPGSSPRWSPDGTKIVWHQCVNCQLGTNYELFTYDVATNAVSRLTDNRTSETHPAWSPNGRRIAFVSNRDYVEADSLRFRKDLYRINADGSNLQRLTKNGNATRPKWSPDGNRIAFEWNIQGNDIFIYDFAGRQIQNIETGFQFAGNPLWNKDGTQLFIFGRETEQSKPEAKLITIESSSVNIIHKITLDKIGRNYDWYND